jgi:hypothetical protein
MQRREARCERRRHEVWKASSPEVASATTTNRAARSICSRTPRRTRAWSSTSRIPTRAERGSQPSAHRSGSTTPGSFSRSVSGNQRSQQRHRPVPHLLLLRSAIRVPATVHDDTAPPEEALSFVHLERDGPPVAADHLHLGAGRSPLPPPAGVRCRGGGSRVNVASGSAGFCCRDAPYRATRGVVLERPIPAFPTWLHALPYRLTAETAAFFMDARILATHQPRPEEKRHDEHCSNAAPGAVAADGARAGPPLDVEPRRGRPVAAAARRVVGADP